MTSLHCFGMMGMAAREDRCREGGALRREELRKAWHWEGQPVDGRTDCKPG